VPTPTCACPGSTTRTAPEAGRGGRADTVGGRATRTSNRILHAVGAGGARPHGGRHQRAVSHDVPRLRPGADLRERDGHGHRRGARQRQDRPDDDLWSRRAPAQPADLRLGPGDDRRGDPPPVRRRPSGPHRHQLRLPGRQGHAQGWRCRGTGQAESLACHPALGSGRGVAQRCARDGQVPHWLVRHVADLHLDGPDRGRRGCGRHRAACPHRRAALCRVGQLGRDRPAEGSGARDPRARQRRHLGGGRRIGDDAPHRLRRGGHRPRLPRAPVVVPRPGRRAVRPCGATVTDAR
jgi:hypothetical protein